MAKQTKPDQRTRENYSKWGRLGGAARALKLTRARRRDIARHAALVRWGKA